MLLPRPAEAGSPISRVVLIGVFVLLTIVLFGTLFYVRSRRIMEEQLRERLRTTAAMAALQFTLEDLAQIRGRADMEKPAFAEVVGRLRQVREIVPSIRFAYIMRRTGDPFTLEFVADASALSSERELDRNRNGIVDGNERASFPGDTYNIMGVSALQEEAFTRPTADPVVTEDQWGRVISGYAPIRDADGHTVAVLGVDMDTREFFSIAQSVFSPVAFLLFILSGVFLAAYVILFVSWRRMEVLEGLEAERSALMNLAFHQIGAPLATFKWWLEILRERDGAKFCENNDVCMQMGEGITRMDSILQALREASRVHEGTVPYEARDASLCAIIEREVRLSAATLQHRRQSIHLQLSPCGEHVRIDTKLIGGVIRELLDNATTYSPPGTAITVRVTREGKFVRVEVQDEGIGINRKDLPHIFEKFTRGENALRLKPVGNGLGLFIARGIIDRAGGKMGVVSEDGKGSTFWFTVPVG